MAKMSPDNLQPKPPSQPSNPKPGVLRKIGTAVFAVGLLILADGAVGFWLINALPPNGGASGRLPSLYILGAGMIVTLLGLALRGIPSAWQKDPTDPASKKSIPTSYGLLLILTILLVVIFLISRM